MFDMPTGISTLIKRTTARENMASRHQGAQLRDPVNPPDSVVIRYLGGLRGALSWTPYYVEKRELLERPMTNIPFSVFK